MAKRSSWGSIERYKPGVYQIRYPLPPDPDTGKRRQGFETLHGTKAEATARLAQLRMLHDKRQASSRMTVSMLWETRYLQHIQRLAKSTVRGYVSAYNAHIAPAFGSWDLERLTKRDVQEWLDGMSYGAAKSCFAVLRAMYSFAEDEELTDNGVMRKRYSMPDAKKPARKVNTAVHTEEELRSILQAAKGEPWEGAYILSAFGGMRRSEAFGVRWEDVEFLEGGCAIVHVRRGVQLLGGEVQIVPTKTERSERDVAIPSPYADRLRRLFLESLGTVYVCDDGHGGPANPERMSDAYRRWHMGKPFPYVPWKNLRNSYATMLHARGVDLADVARLLGHTTPVITYQHYDRPSAEQLASIVGILGEKK